MQKFVILYLDKMQFIFIQMFAFLRCWGGYREAVGRVCRGKGGDFAVKSYEGLHKG